MKVYVLTSGLYEEYRIEGVFSTRENCEAARAKFEGAELHDPQEYECDELMKPEYKMVYGAKIDLETGEISSGWKSGPRLTDPEVCTVQVHGVRSWLPNAIYVDSPVSASHAEKVAVQQREQWLRDGRRFEQNSWLVPITSPSEEVPEK